MEWITDNKDILSLVIAVVIPCVAGFWAVFRFFRNSRERYAKYTAELDARFHELERQQQERVRHEHEQKNQSQRKMQNIETRLKKSEAKQYAMIAVLAIGIIVLVVFAIRRSDKDTDFKEPS